MRITLIDSEMRIQYDDPYELNYQLLNAIGLYADPNGYVFDQDTKTQIMILGKRLKTTIDSHMIRYPGEGDVMLDPLRNVQQVTMLLGYYIDKKIASGEMTFLSQFIEERNEDSKTALTIKLNPCKSITGQWYGNRCLKFVHMIFLLDYQNVDLSNFDTEEAIKIL